MAYKISDKAILVESGGENILIAESITFERGGLTILDSDYTLSPTFVSNYFTSFQGTLRGYRSGGSSGPTSVNTIDDYPFASDTSATDVGDLTVARNDIAGASSSTHGYAAGGQLDPNGPTRYNVIDKFPFSSDDNASDVGDNTTTRRVSSGHSSSTHGYSSGGYSGSIDNIIDKYPFSSDANASDVGDLSVGRDRTAGHSSSTHGYTSGGGIFPPYSSQNIIDKFPFSTDGNATDVGDLPAIQEGGGGTSSTTHGYLAGGWGPPSLNIIQKFSFVSDGNGSDVGDLTETRTNSQSASSAPGHGYTNGGNSDTTIDKYSFTSDGNASDVGELTNDDAYAATGHQI